MRRSGIDVIGEVPWGTHFCQFYQTSADLLDTLVPYFEAGLRAGEFCMWITSQPLETAAAGAALRKAMPDLDGRIAAGQIEILDHDQWYMRSGRFDADVLLQGWVDRLERALAEGLAGLRLSGNTFWLERSDWDRFVECERKINSLIGRYRMIALCTYSLEKCTAVDVLDVVANHQFALAKRDGRWESMERAEQRRAGMERERLLRELDVERLRWQAMVEAMPDQVVVSDAAGKIIYMNPAVMAAAEELGTPVRAGLDVARHPLYYDLHKPDGAMFEWHDLPLMRAALRGEEVRNSEVIARGPDGAERIALWDASPVRDAEGRVLGAVSVAHDFTERRRAEQALRDREQRLSLATEAAALGVFEWDARADRAIWENDRMYEIFGRSREDGPLTKAQFVGSMLWPEDVEPFERALVEGMKPGREFRAVCRIRRRGETELRWVEFAGRFELAAGGSPVRLVSVVSDITDRKRSEEQLSALNVELEKRVAERTAQLTALAKDLATTEQRERKRLAQIIHDHLQQLLVTAKLSADVLGSKVRSKALKGLVVQLSEALTESIKASRSLVVELSPPVLYEDGLAAGLAWLARRMQEQHGLAVEVMADPVAEPASEQMRLSFFEAVREMLFNVVKHSGEHYAWVSLVRHGSNEIRLTVTDEGEGFDPKRVDAGAGSGVFGLFSIRERLRLLGGRMEVDTAPGRGCRITLIAPTTEHEAHLSAQDPMQGPAPLPDAQHDKKHAGSRSRNGRRLRVVLADDHAVVRQGLVRLLHEQPDIEVVGEAADGLQAVELARELTPDVVIMDVGMPRLTGIEATRLLSAELPSMRIIGLSLFEAADMADTMTRAGASAYLNKAGPADELLAAIRAS